MTAADANAACVALGVRLRVVGENLRVEAPLGTLDEEVRNALATHRNELIGLIQASETGFEQFEREWRDACARAREGYAKTLIVPDPATLETAITLELSLSHPGWSYFERTPRSVATALAALYGGATGTLRGDGRVFVRMRTREPL